MMKYAGVKLTVVAALMGIGVACGPVSADVKDDNTDPKVADRDGDGIVDANDNCVDVPNKDQLDVDADGVGDTCDSLIDVDGDAVGDDVDNCAGVGNPGQEDGDLDGVGDICDNCPTKPNDDQLDADSDGIGDACPCDGCGATDWCVEHPALGDECVVECPSFRQGADQKCCPLGSIPNDSGVCEYADIFVDGGRVLTSLLVETQQFSSSHPDYLEGCVQNTGSRLLLRFDTTTPNNGPGDLYLGDPRQEDVFVYSPAHGHNHFESYAAYEIQDQAGNLLAPGHKQAFCLMDFEPRNCGQGYHCGDQGISAGCMDTYYNTLDCQYVDITGVAPGEVVLQIAVNHEQILAEGDYSNNVVHVPLTLLDRDNDGEIDGAR